MLKLLQNLKLLHTKWGQLSFSSVLFPNIVFVHGYRYLWLCSLLKRFVSIVTSGDGPLVFEKVVWRTVITWILLEFLYTNGIINSKYQVLTTYSRDRFKKINMYLSFKIWLLLRKYRSKKKKKWTLFFPCGASELNIKSILFQYEMVATACGHQQSN